MAFGGLPLANAAACRMPYAMSWRHRMPVVGLVPSMGCNATCIGAGMPDGTGSGKEYERSPSARDMTIAGRHGI